MWLAIWHNNAGGAIVESFYKLQNCGVIIICFTQAEMFKIGYSDFPNVFYNHSQHIEMPQYKYCTPDLMTGISHKLKEVIDQMPSVCNTVNYIKRESGIKLYWDKWIGQQGYKVVPAIFSREDIEATVRAQFGCVYFIQGPCPLISDNNRYLILGDESMTLIQPELKELFALVALVTS